MIALLAYALGGMGAVSVAVARELHALGLADSVESLSYGMPCSERRASRVAGCVGLVLLPIVALALQWSAGSAAIALRWPDLAPLLALLPLLAWVLGRVVFFSLRGTPTLERATSAEPDLFDLDRHFALGRISVRVTLVWTLGIALLAPWIFVPGLTVTMGVFIALALVVPMFTLFVQLRGARASLRAAKRAELERIARELRALRGTAGAASGTAAPAGRTADLLALRAYVESVRDWPIDAPTLRRFGLYLLIPLGGWLGGAVVERVVGALIE